MIPLCPSCGSAKDIIDAGPDCGESDPPVTVGLTWICKACRIYFDWEPGGVATVPDEPCTVCAHRISAHRGPREGVVIVRYYCQFCDCVLLDDVDIISPN